MILRRILPTLVAIGAILALLGCQQNPLAGMQTGPTPTPAAQPSTEGIVSAKAVVVPRREANVSFKVAGRVQEVLASEGEAVKAGQELARLETRDLELALREAEAGLKSAQAQLAKAKAGPSPEDIAVADSAVSIADAGVKAAETSVQVAQGNLGTAQAAVRTAQANLSRAQEGPSAEQLNAAASVMAAAEAGVRQAQAAYDKIATQPDAGAYPQSLALEQATIELNRARASYDNLQKGATPAEIRVYQEQVAQAQAGVRTAEAQVAQAQSQVETARAQLFQAEAQRSALKAGTRPEDVAVAEAGVAQAEAAVAAAQAALDDATLRAPFDATVGTVLVSEGELAAPEAPAFHLGDLAQLQIETEDLSEVDVHRVREGQTAAITIDALPDARFSGKVISVAPLAVDRRGDKVFTVTLEITEGSVQDLRWGMSGFVEIAVDS